MEPGSALRMKVKQASNHHVPVGVSLRNLSAPFSKSRLNCPSACIYPWRPEQPVLTIYFFFNFRGGLQMTLGLANGKVKTVVRQALAAHRCKLLMQY